MTLERRLEVATPLPTLRPLDKALNTLTGRHRRASRGNCHVRTSTGSPIATGFGKTMVQGPQLLTYVRCHNSRREIRRMFWQSA